MADDDQKPYAIASVVPRIPEQLDAQAQAEIRDAQEVMRQLIMRIPRTFDYGDEIALVFQPRRDD